MLHVEQVVRLRVQQAAGQQGLQQRVPLRGLVGERGAAAGAVPEGVGPDLDADFWGEGEESARLRRRWS